MMRKSIFGFCRIGSIFRRCSFFLICITIIYLLMANRDFLPTSYSTQKNEVINAGNSRDNDDIRRTLSTKDSAEPQDPIYLKSIFSLNITNNFNVFGSEEKLPLCPAIETNTALMGHLGQALLLIETLDENEVVQWNQDLQPGGSWTPSNCQARHKIAIIIPYRDRKSHLVRLLDFLIPILKRQLLDFRFIVTEQHGDDLFNKGRIMNAAFVLAQKLKVDCVIFHDVDMFPQDDRSPYDCSTTPRHLGAFVNTLGYQLWYKEIVGGALTMNMNDYVNVNGYSNMYWAWGGEDDDMGTRILALNYTIERPDSKFIRYSMLKHIKRKRLATKTVYKLLQEAANRFTTDGLSEKDKWKIVKMTIKPLYYHLLVDVGKPPQDWKDS